MAHVLLIDDDLMVSQLLKEHLSNGGHEVSTACLVEDGFQMALKIAPDLIMLDVMLPDATGFQACGRFRKESRTQEIPIIMMSGTARSKSQQAIGRQMGANDFILKPFNVIEVGDKVDTILRGRPPTKKAVPLPQASAPCAEPAVEEQHTVGENSRIAYASAAATGITVISPDREVLTKNGAPAPAFDIDNLLSVMRNAAEMTEDQKPAAEEPSQEPAPVQAETLKTSSDVAWKIFLAHLIMTGIGLAASILSVKPIQISWSNVIQSLILVAGGWVFFLGLLGVISIVLKIALDFRQALNLISLTVLPIIFRNAAGVLAEQMGKAAPLLSSLTNRVLFSPSVFWMRPLDIFEVAAVAIFVLVLQRRTASSIRKCIAASMVMTLVWAFANWGYFRAF